MTISKRSGILALLLSGSLAVLIPACTTPSTQMERIAERGEVRIVTIYSPATYLVDDDSESGFEYELARLFAQQLNVNLNVVIAANKAEMIRMLKQDQADIAVGLLKSSWVADPELVSGPDYYSVSQQVVYHSEMGEPKTPEDLYPFALHVPEGLISVTALDALKQQHPDFNWTLHEDKSSSNLIEDLHNEQIAYAAVYSNELILAQQRYPELRAAFNLAEESPLIWLTRKSEDTGLQRQVDRFFETIKQNDYLTELEEYYYGPAKEFDYVDQRKFVDRFTSRLPKFEPLFKQAAADHKFDWRLLAALSYQESHWNERARSPTGVRGLMMLTQDTARRMRVKNRLDPVQSIVGGSAYIRQMIDKIPERIPEPDRIWLGLASYNIGLGHLEDARKLTQKLGRDPDKWQDVRETLPLLGHQQWYSQTTNGQARGTQAVVFVENIRKYYNTLVQLTHETVPVSESPSISIMDRINRFRLLAL